MTASCASRASPEGGGRPTFDLTTTLMQHNNIRKVERYSTGEEI